MTQRDGPKRDWVALAGLILGVINLAYMVVWQGYLYYSSQTVPARLIVTDIEELDLGISPDLNDQTLAFTSKFLVTSYVVTSHEFSITATEGSFKWFNVTERLGRSYVSPDQGVVLTGRRDGSPQRLILPQSGPVTMQVNVLCSFRVNQTAIRRFGYIPLGQFYFTLEYQDLKTNYVLRQTNMTRVSWSVRPG